MSTLIEKLPQPLDSNFFASFPDSKKKKKNKKKNMKNPIESNTSKGEGTNQRFYLENFFHKKNSYHLYSRKENKKKRQHPDSNLNDNFSKIPKLKDNQVDIGKYEVIFPSTHTNSQSFVHSNGKNHVDLSSLGQLNNQTQFFYPPSQPQPHIDFMNQLTNIPQPVYNVPNLFPPMPNQPFDNNPLQFPPNINPNMGFDQFPTFPNNYPYIGSEMGLPPNHPLPSNLFPIPNVQIPSQNTQFPLNLPFSHQNIQYQPTVDPVTDKNVNNEKDKVLIVLDTANLCFSHGKGKVFSIDGFMIAYDYYKKKGYKVVGFIASYYIRTQKHEVSGNWEDLERLMRENILILTPPQDYDDSYMLEYAKRHQGYIVSNDMYRDHLQKFKNERQREKVKDWIKKHTISYTFIQDEFLPNPDAKVPKDSNKKQQKKSYINKQKAGKISTTK